MSLIRNAFAAAALAAASLLAGAAEAGVCTGAAPAEGAELKGPVLHVEDGETLCVARGFTPDQWIEVKLAPSAAARVSDAPAPPREVLMAAAFGKDAVCRIEAVVDGRPVARCAVEGRPVAELTGQPAVLKSAASWR